MYHKRVKPKKYTYYTRIVEYFEKNNNNEQLNSNNMKSTRHNNTCVGKYSQTTYKNKLNKQKMDESKFLWQTKIHLRKNPIFFLRI